MQKSIIDNKTVEQVEEVLKTIGRPAPKQQTIVRAEKKIHRNDPCRCGSGKKFKNCCNN